MSPIKFPFPGVFGIQKFLRLFIFCTKQSGIRCNYAILMDASNHNSEKQALARVDRCGQKAHVHLYRLVAMSNPAERIIATRSQLRWGLYSGSETKQWLVNLFKLGGESGESAGIDESEGIRRPAEVTRMTLYNR